jgi:hypothetical protein
MINTEQITTVSTPGASIYNLHYHVTINIAGFEVLTAVVMQISVFWDITLCSPLKVNCHQTIPGNRTLQYVQSH